MVVAVTEEQRRKRVVITVLVLAAIALGFYIASFVRFW
jgi:hypothetical protein